MLKNLKIATKVFTGFGVILALLVGLSVVGGASLNTAGGYFHDYREAARQRNQLNRVGITMQRVRVNVRNYILDPKEDIAKQTIDRLGLLSKDVAEAKNLLASRKDLLSQVEKLEKAEHEWKTLFEGVVAAQKKADGLLRDVLEKIGGETDQTLAQMTQNAAKIGNADAAIAMGEMGGNLLRARLAMSRFLRSSEAADADRARKELAEMGEDIAKLMPELKVEENKVKLAKVEELRKQYLAGAEETVKAVNERNDLFKVRMTALGNDMVKTGDDLTGTLRDFQDALGPKAESAINTA
ncbi:MAG: Tar ligand binding domain-containing protein, partial [Magnetospirillum sp. WYHS-4]